ncbi:MULTISPECIES: RdgB/HAM1 family non-canonical purine NTP pyrophosphatase [unclassified Lysobacter]|uniref:RdgB/HAM1 family non-canonical purine NTP pyrophosphatase n=1 Tax=unclassified Lysobacter TaxID=2635362 RepID=UPI001BEBCA55|nr:MULTISPECIES: RdgB/HAM1 family non-canonical purine NTP pyrophosphatase [unclassified Lysobacter]MBT2748146.1 RdgB/HAM1 family non-canonical purine NTP pyrophosphatase [Lysobacter sp. ISL-42]MBT2751057.1 RdgB/HAM1 family non-canonical purine NTP pyrophosphatase [Lysobacter sp. ISL-50]MBT2776904.1 RdgB/HAM1 family non-canonical purine NTP pyrophosphatase [Lysobacter sp. ISL-54]MBT2783373.1 RdgB/HAM1 family non-canonical purine NTP pyrophosphatase [Lysobacter sp. ISL-52]
MRLVLASSNAGKLAELRDLLSDTGIELVAQSDLGVEDIEETGSTFVENALLKARHACAVTGLPALADDSGICVDALGGAPGLYSARYHRHGDAQGNIDKLLSALKDVPDDQRGAHFYAVIVLLRHAGDPRPVIAEGVWHGRILHQRQGDRGFGYQPVFFDTQHQVPAGEIDDALKNRVSHRALALAALRARLAEVAR